MSLVVLCLTCAKELLVPNERDIPKCCGRMMELTGERRGKLNDKEK